MIECPGCGSNLIYDIGRQRMSCKACGMNYNVEAVKKQLEGEASENMDINVFICPQCAGEIYSTDDAITGYCSFCGATNMLTSRLKSERRPDYIVPFLVTKERCKDVYIEMMKKAIYAPGKLKSRKHIQEFRGIYMPYWMCDVEQDGPIEMRAIEMTSKTFYNLETTYLMKANVQSKLSNVTIDASSLFADNISEKIGPFNADNVKPFSMGYLSGFYADLPDVDYTIYEDDVKHALNKRSKDKIRENVRVVYNRTISNNRPISEIFHPKIRNTKTALLPVWFMSYKNGERISYATVNGQTGKVVADIPMDPKRFLLGCLIGIVPVYFLFEIFLTIHPIALTFWVAMIALAISFFHYYDMKKIGIRERQGDDKGLAARHSLNRRLEKEEYLRAHEERKIRKYELDEDVSDLEEPVVVTTHKYKVTEVDIAVLVFGLIFVFLIFLGLGFFSVEKLKVIGPFVVPIANIVCFVNMIKASKSVSHVSKKSGLGSIWIVLAMLVTSAIEILRPVKDSPYYIACLVLCAGVVLTLLDVVFSYNRLVTRPLPQFEYTGGDDRA